MIRAQQMMLDGSAEQMPQNNENCLKRFLGISADEGGLLTPAQAAIVLGISNQRVLQLIEKGSLRAYRCFGRDMIPARELEARQTTKPPVGRPRKQAA